MYLSTIVLLLTYHSKNSWPKNYLQSPALGLVLPWRKCLRFERMMLYIFLNCRSSRPFRLLLAQVLKFATCELIVGSCNARQKICNWRIGIMSTVKNRDLTCIVANLWSPHHNFFRTQCTISPIFGHTIIYLLCILFRDWSFW